MTNPDISYREEGLISSVSKVADDESSPNPSGRRHSDSAVLKTRDKHLRIGTWNVRTLYQSGKLDNAIQEMEHMDLDVMGIAEARWTESGKIIKKEHTMVYSGGETHHNGVGILMRNNIAKSLQGYWAISDRVIMVNLHGRPFNINILQVYAPTQDHNDEEIGKVLSRCTTRNQLCKVK